MTAPTAPSIHDVLSWVAGSPDEPWFPSRYAAEHSLDRNSLDSPLGELRQAGLVKVAAWEKGLGQGYRITPEGASVLAQPKSGSAPEVAVDPEIEEEDPPAVASPALLFANITWFVVGLFTAWRLGVGVEFLKADGHPGAVQVLFKTGAATGLSVLQGGWWRLATCCFVHVGLFHLAANMLTLGMLGPVVEGLWGKRRFALIYGVSGLVGSMVAIGLEPQSTLAGASGALWGVLAAMIAWLLGHRSELRPGVAADWGRKLGLIVFINLLISLAPHISMAGHLGGGIAGFLVSLCIDWSPKKSPRRKFLGLLGALGVLLAGFLFLLASMRYSEKWVAVRERDRIQQMDRDRSRLRAAVGERMGKVHIRAVIAISDEVRDPLKWPSPDVVARARELKAHAEEAAFRSQSVSGEMAEGYRAYFAAVVAFAETVEHELETTSPDFQPILARRKDAEAAWIQAERKK